MFVLRGLRLQLYPRYWQAHSPMLYCGKVWKLSSSVKTSRLCTANPNGRYRLWSRITMPLLCPLKGPGTGEHLVATVRRPPSTGWSALQRHRRTDVAPRSLQRHICEHHNLGEVGVDHVPSALRRFAPTLVEDAAVDILLENERFKLIPQ